MPNPLPPETTPEWTADDERHLRRVVDPDTMPYVYSPLEKRWIGEIIRLRSEREAQDAEIEKLLSKYDQQRIDGVALYNDLLAIGVDRPGCSPNVRSELSRSRSVPEPNSQFVGCDEKENDCTGCDGSGRLECGASVVRSEIPEPGTGKWYSQGYVDDLNARLAATQTANASASVPNTGTAREIDAEQVRGICAKIDTIDSSWTDDRYTYVRVGELRLLSNAFVGYRPSSAPSRGSEQ